MVLQLLAVLVLGLMCGSELNVGLFAHPTIERQPEASHIAMRSTFAGLLGRVMPFWMGASLILNLMLLLPSLHLSHRAFRLTAFAVAIQIASVLFSLFGPVPINDRISHWTPSSIPNDWRAQEHRWDLYHWVRTGGLIVAFALLVRSMSLR